MRESSVSFRAGNGKLVRMELVLCPFYRPGHPVELRAMDVARYRTLEFAKCLKAVFQKTDLLV